MQTSRYHRPWLYPSQERALFDSRRYAIIEASTKSGKTTGALVWLLEQALQGVRGDNYWWIAPVYGQAKIAYRRMKMAVPDDLYTSKEDELMITLANGAVIWFKSGEKPDNLYGEDVKAAVIDEASRLREEAWIAVRSTLTATRGPIRIIGNVKGRRNWAYRMARRAEEGHSEMGYHRLTAHDAVEAGILDQEEIDDAKAQLPKNVFDELYLALPSEDEGNPFGFKYINNCLSQLSENPPLVLGVDLAKSVDWSVLIGLDGFGKVCAFRRWQSPWRETIAYLKKFAEIPMVVDSTGVGDPVAEELSRAGLPVSAFKFSAKSKQQLMEGLCVAIQSGSVGFPDNEIAQELKEFEYSYTRTGVRYEAPSGFHDDCVMALALAWDGFTDRRSAYEAPKTSLLDHPDALKVTKRNPFVLASAFNENEPHRILRAKR